MRDVDRVEAAAFGHSPKGALRAGIIAGRAWTTMVDGRPEAMFGLVVASAIDGLGRPWMLGTDAIYRHGRDLIGQGPVWLARFRDSMPRLSNLVSRENARAIRLLRRWDFDVGSEVVMIGGVAFVRFEMGGAGV